MDSELFCEDHHCEMENQGKIDAVSDPIDLLDENTEEYLVSVIRHLSKRLDVLEGRYEM